MMTTRTRLVMKVEESKAHHIRHQAADSDLLVHSQHQQLQAPSSSVQVFYSKSTGERFWAVREN